MLSLLRIPVQVKGFQTCSGVTQPPTQWVSDALSAGIKRTRLADDHPLQTTAEIQKARSHSSITVNSL